MSWNLCFLCNSLVKSSSHCLRIFLFDELIHCYIYINDEDITPQLKKWFSLVCQGLPNHCEFVIQLVRHFLSGSLWNVLMRFNHKLFPGRTACGWQTFVIRSTKCSPRLVSSFCSGSIFSAFSLKTSLLCSISYTNGRGSDLLDDGKSQHRWQSCSYIFFHIQIVGYVISFLSRKKYEKC